ncbi:polysaccharide pyruvyl transferase family protein [Microbacterium sp. NPDC055903]
MGRSVRARAPHAKRVLIRTLPLGRGNYGCLLQTFALQQTLAELGFQAATDVSERIGLLAAARRVAAATATRLLRRPVGYRERQKFANAELWRFIRNTLRTDSIFRFGGFPHRQKYLSYGAFIAGSDQVWRPEYGDIGSYLFDFVDGPGRRIAYAASFGTDRPTVDWNATRPLIERFYAVSVREHSGVALCEHEWSIGAEQVPDPTLLPDLEEYRRLAATGPRVSNGDYLLTYVLDQSPRMVHGIRALQHALGLQVHDLHRQIPRSAGDFRRDPSAFVRPSVEEWLRGFQDATVVVTDSFHGTVFAILFNRPFVTIANSARGLARFESLLSTFGLEHRLVLAGEDDDTSDAVTEALETPIDWDRVNAQVAVERERGIGFLERALSPVLSAHG